MRKTLAAAALGGALVLGAPQIANAETATPEPTATATEHTTTTVEHKDRTGWWGLLGLAGLAGLAGLKKKPEQHVVRERRTEPVRTTPVHTERHDATHTSAPEGAHLRKDTTHTTNTTPDTTNTTPGTNLDNDTRRGL